MVQAALLSPVTASVAFTISETVLFAPMRAQVKRANPWLGKLVNCGDCLGHWVAFGLAAVYRPRLFQSGWFLDDFLTALVMAWLARFQWITLY